ncbi:hypothetical protein [Mesorhizobium sp. M0130]
MNGAGAARAEIAALFRSDQIKPLASQVEQRDAGIEIGKPVILSVHPQPQ